VNQKLDKLVREMRAQNNNDDEDLNRTRFDELKKEHQQQQEKLKETKNQFDALETQVLNSSKTKEISIVFFFLDDIINSRTRFSSFISFTFIIITICIFKI
jgi:hypothetical protein